MSAVSSKPPVRSRSRREASAPLALAALTLFAMACDSGAVTAPSPSETVAEGQPQAAASSEGTPAPSPQASEEQSFGAPLEGEGERVGLAALIDDPETYAGRVVRTEGVISAVCQRMGCWMELRDDAGRPVRVPMAGHSFFLPRDISGRRALVEGPVALRPLSEAEREHLESEGAEAAETALELSATSVVVRGVDAI